MITILELETGILLLKRKDPSQSAILQAWLQEHVLNAFSERVLMLDLPVATCCAKLHVPDPKSYRDSIIAATALTHSMTVVTRNVSDFEQTGANIFNPWDFQYDQ